MIRKTAHWTQPCLVLHLTLLGLSPNPVRSEPLDDTAPPAVNEVPDGQSPVATDFDRVTFFAEPKARAADAVDADWPRFLGPNDDASSPETHLLAKFSEGSLAKIWEMEKGSGYTSPVIVDSKLVFFDRIEDEEVIDCLDPATGKTLLVTRLSRRIPRPLRFQQRPSRQCRNRLGKSLYTLGVTSQLTCLDLATGAVIWQRDLMKEFDRASMFFGHGACPDHL